MPDRVTATASVATPTPERYAKQLAAHLGRRLEVREEADGLRLVFGAGDGTTDGTTDGTGIGDCLLRSQDAALELCASAADAAGLERITQVVGSHLERFGQRNELVVGWHS
jgi:hypothetical protein